MGALVTPRGRCGSFTMGNYGQIIDWIMNFLPDFNFASNFNQGYTTEPQMELRELGSAKNQNERFTICCLLQRLLILSTQTVHALCLVLP